mmetsp:Transcript_4875/g.12081  ORF Transcript_4875/g.12081 Transcript_4875/m.12081 type:complete len:206 (-) Transcript_4875:1889-2506(-)
MLLHLCRSLERPTGTTRAECAPLDHQSYGVPVSSSSRSAFFRGRAPNAENRAFQHFVHQVLFFLLPQPSALQGRSSLHREFSFHRHRPGRLHPLSMRENGAPPRLLERPGTELLLARSLVERCQRVVVGAADELIRGARRQLLESVLLRLCRRKPVGDGGVKLLLHSVSNGLRPSIRHALPLGQNVRVREVALGLRAVVLRRVPK